MIGESGAGGPSMTTRSFGLRGVGVGFRRELAHALLADPAAVDFVEVVAEASREGRARREAAALAEIWPVIPHGVKLSLGSAEGIDRSRARELGRLAREVRAPVVSEHVSFVRAGGREIGHLTELPMTREAIAVVVKNVALLRRELPDVPLLLENVARAFVWPARLHEMDEGEFYAEIARRTGCDLLLDVGNLYANARNAGIDPAAFLETFPLDRVAMLHVAGGVTEHGFYFDTHAHPVPEPVFALVARVRAACPDVPILLERDAALDQHQAILAELARLRHAEADADAEAEAEAEAEADADAEAEAEAEAEADLAALQKGLAEVLTDAAPSTRRSIQRARGVLERKRADDALPLLPELGPRISSHEALALGRIAETPRLPTMTAVADAMRIAEAARAVPALARPAARDLAYLSARFAGGPEGPRPRTMPYVARHALGDGAALWAVKSFGPGAPVRVMERGGAARRGAG